MSMSCKCTSFGRMCIKGSKDMLYIKDQANVKWVAKVFLFLFTWILVMLWVVF
jgi:hypothetical protein